MPRFRAAALILLLLLTSGVEAKRRSARAPGGTAFAAYPLHSVELVANTSDLQPLDDIVRNASIVGLGDATHGTHEFYTLRLRLIDTLVRRHGFTALSIEMPFPIGERIDAYVQGGAGDPRALLRELNDRLLYFFWNTEEVLAVIEWVRDYNAHRGDRPAVHIAGSDIYDETGAVAGVLDYLHRVDPTAAANAERDYACVLAGTRNGVCRIAAEGVRNALAARAHGTPAFDDALHHADIVLQFFHAPVFEPRERSMAANLLWVRDHRGRVMHWGHQEHVGKLDSRFANGITMGKVLAQQLGDEYAAIGTLTGSGTFLQWQQLSPGIFAEVLSTFEDPAEGTYEWHFRQRGLGAMLVPLRRAVPGTMFRTGGTLQGFSRVAQPLHEKLDAVIYVDRTTPTRPLR
ncbi:MAG TPA: erythromycin esterase family protein [Thermoanaerobaculia bacterium]|nr:erythromycin esterase family protein [Thermoanaerobaculia bacterium]